MTEETPQKARAQAELSMPCADIFATTEQLQHHSPSPISQIESFLARSVVFPTGTAVVVATWSLGTYLWDAFDCCGYLLITSPLPACGKSMLGLLLSMICQRGKLVTGMTDATLFRIVDLFRPTLIVDEGEAISNSLRTLLNAGYEHGARVPRCDGKTGVREWEVYCPKAVCAINELPETIRSRGIEIRMRRCQTWVPFRRRLILPVASQLRDELALWAAAHRDAVAEAYSRGFRDMGVVGRDADVWEPLFAIMSVAAPARLNELKEAAQQLSREKAKRDADTSLIRLLQDIQAVVKVIRVEKLSSDRLVNHLRNLHEGDSAWRRLTTHDLARMLRRIEVYPQQLWIDGHNVRGYLLQDFFDSFERYLAADLAGQVETEKAS